jgi:hypothetical protein
MARAVELHEVEPHIVGAPGPQPEGLRQRRQAAYDEDDDDQPLTGPVDMPTPQERKLGMCLGVVSGIDVVMSTIVMGVSFGYAYKDSGVSLYCLGIQALSHVLSSLTLAVRFLAEGRLPEAITQGASDAAETLLRAQRRKHLVREQALSVTMGCVMLISAAGLLFKAARKFKFWDKWYLDHQEFDANAQFAEEFLAWYGFSIYLLQAVLRFVCARKLRRQLVWHGFVASIISLIFLFILGVAASYQKEWSWKAEPIAAAVLCLVSLIEGVRIIILHIDDMDTRMRWDPRA